MKKALMSYFKFTKKEFNGVLVLLSAIFLIALYPVVYGYFQKPEIYNYTSYKREIEAFNASAKKYRPYSYKELKNQIEDKEFAPQYFNFDPNNLSEANWHKLGLKKFQIKIIKNYEHKGGKFYKKEDLRKIYSITPADYQRLEPYIVIAPTFKRYPVYEKKVHSPAVKKTVTVDINSADSTELEQLRGIGATFVNRIIKYRNRLGGFYSIEQLREVYGIDSSRFDGFREQVIISANADLRKINVNTATFEDMKQHPYLTFKQMNAIINYRKQHGNYNSISDLKKVLLLNEEILRKIEPYLAF